MKKIFFLAAVATLTFTASCKKQEALNGPGGFPKPQDGMYSFHPELPPIKSMTTPTPPPNGQFPVMEFEKTDHDFGIITEGSKVVHIFHFKNSGKSDLIISNAVGSCGCTVPEYPKAPVKPGESGTIKVSFNSAGKNGNQQKNVAITTNTKNGNEILVIKASVNPKA